MEQLEHIGNVTMRPMMGEYLLYLDGLLFGGVYDMRLLVKITDTNSGYGLPEAIPYEGAKKMYMIENIEDRELTKNVILDTCKGLKASKKK